MKNLSPRRPSDLLTSVTKADQELARKTAISTSITLCELRLYFPHSSYSKAELGVALERAGLVKCRSCGLWAAKTYQTCDICESAIK